MLPEGMPYDPIQGQGHGGPKVAKIDCQSLCGAFLNFVSCYVWPCASIIVHARRFLSYCTTLAHQFVQ